MLGFKFFWRIFNVQPGRQYFLQLNFSTLVNPFHSNKLLNESQFDAKNHIKLILTSKVSSFRGYKKWLQKRGWLPNLLVHSRDKLLWLHAFAKLRKISVLTAQGGQHVIHSYSWHLAHISHCEKWQQCVSHIIIREKLHFVPSPRHGTYKTKD